MGVAIRKSGIPADPFDAKVDAMPLRGAEYAGIGLPPFGAEDLTSVCAGFEAGTCR